MFQTCFECGRRGQVLQSHPLPISPLLQTPKHVWKAARISDPDPGLTGLRGRQVGVGMGGGRNGCFWGAPFASFCGKMRYFPGFWPKKAGHPKNGHSYHHPSQPPLDASFEAKKWLEVNFPSRGKVINFPSRHKNSFFSNSLFHGKTGHFEGK